jgi:hypothetical protein
MKKNKGVIKTNTMRLVERVFDKDIEELLKQWYLDEKKSIAQIAEISGVSNCTIQQWLVLFEIPRRKLTFI